MNKEEDYKKIIRNLDMNIFVPNNKKFEYFHVSYNEETGEYVYKPVFSDVYIPKPGEVIKISKSYRRQITSTIYYITKSEYYAGKYISMKGIAENGSSWMLNIDIYDDNETIKRESTEKSVEFIKTLVSIEAIDKNGNVIKK